jgi:hypothetical protein
MATYIEREAAKKILSFGVGVSAAVALDKVPAADVVAVETVKAWLYAIAMNNVGVKADDVASVCEDISERMDGLRAFARERRGEDE